MKDINREAKLSIEERGQIKENIKKLRLMAGYQRQMDLAAAMGLDKQKFSDRINKTNFKTPEISKLLFLLNARYEDVFPSWEGVNRPVSEAEQIIKTARKQAERGELTPDELEIMFRKYGMITVIDGDKCAS